MLFRSATVRRPAGRVSPQVLAALAAARQQQGGAPVAGVPGGAPVQGLPGGAPAPGLPGGGTGAAPAPTSMKKGGKAKKMAKGGSVGSASKRADGIAERGKTKGKFI